jgi:hypothetical protein
MAELRVGTSPFTATGWPGKFYPEDLPERDYLSYYVTKFDTGTRNIPLSGVAASLARLGIAPTGKDLWNKWHEI